MASNVANTMQNFRLPGMLYAIVGSAILLALSSGCGLRPLHWLEHNTFPASCKTCPGGLPGPDGCRTFDPWCAGYQTTMWRDLGTDCGPARLKKLQAAAAAGTATPANTDATPSDTPPDLPPAFPTPPPGGGDLPPAFPPPPGGEGAKPKDNVNENFPFRPVPAIPPDEEPTNPPRDPLIPPTTEDPGLFPEPKTTPKPFTPSPTESIDDLFNEPNPKRPSGSAPKTDTPSGEKTPAETLPAPGKKPSPPPEENVEDLFPPGGGTPKSPAKPVDTPTIDDVPNLFPKSPANSPSGSEKPVPMPDPSDDLGTKLPDLFPGEGTKRSPEPKEENAPKLFEDGAQQDDFTPPSLIRFGKILPVAGTEEPLFRVRATDYLYDTADSLYAPRRADKIAPATLRIVPR